MLNSSNEVDQQCQLNFTIHLASRRTVIGPRGRTIKAISKQNNVSIKVIRKLRRWPRKHEDSASITSYHKFAYFGLPTNYGAYCIDVDVIIKGTRSGCEEAKEQVLRLAEEGASNVYVAELELEEDRAKFMIGKTNLLQAKYPNLLIQDHVSLDGILCLDGKCVYIKGTKLKVLEAAEELKRIQARIVEETTVLEVKTPKDTLYMICLDANLSPYYGEISVRTNEHDITICGILEKAKEVEAALSEAASRYTTEVIKVPEFIPGNASHTRPILNLLWSQVLKPKYWGKVAVAFDEPYLEIRGKKEIVETFKQLAMSTFEKTTPQIVTIVPGDYRRIRRYDKTYKLGDLAEANDILYRFDRENAYLIDASIATGEKKEGFESRLDAFRSHIVGWTEFLESMETVTVNVGQLQQYMFGMLGGPNKSSIFLDHLKGRPGELSLVGWHKIRLEGPPDAVQGAKEEMEKMVEDVENGTFRAHERTVMVPSKLLTALIGKNREIWRGTRIGTRVHLRIIDQGKGTRSQELVDEDSETPIVISGIKYDVNNAVSRILGSVEELSDRKVVRIKIGATYHRRIVGRNYSHRNKIEKECRVDIRFPRNDLRYPCPKHEDEIVVHGKTADVVEAEKRILGIYQSEKNGAKEKTIDVPLSALKKVRQLLGDRLWDRSDKLNYIGVQLLDEFPCAGVDYSIMEDEESARVTVYGTEKALAGIPKDFEEPRNTNFTATVPAPKEFLDYCESNVWDTILLDAGVDDLSDEQKSNLIQASEIECEVKCTGDERLVEIVVEMIRERLAEWEEHGGHWLLDY